jgi:hypothetical protein
MKRIVFMTAAAVARNASESSCEQADAQRRRAGNSVSDSDNTHGRWLTLTSGADPKTGIF